MPAGSDIPYHLDIENSWIDTLTNHGDHHHSIRYLKGKKSLFLSFKVIDQGRAGKLCLCTFSQASFDLQLTQNRHRPHRSARLAAMHICRAAPTLEPSLSFRMKEVYEERKAGEDLDADYGNNVGGPPKNRRAGEKMSKDRLRYCRSRHFT